MNSQELEREDSIHIVGKFSHNRKHVIKLQTYTHFEAHVLKVFSMIEGNCPVLIETCCSLIFWQNRYSLDQKRPTRGARLHFKGYEKCTSQWQELDKLSVVGVARPELKVLWGAGVY